MSNIKMTFLILMKHGAEKATEVADTFLIPVRNATGLNYRV